MAVLILIISLATMIYCYYTEDEEANYIFLKERYKLESVNNKEEVTYDDSI